MKLIRAAATVATAAAVAIPLGGCIIVNENPGAAYASAPKQNLVGGDIRASLDEDGDFRVAGADVRLSGRVGGTLNVAAADFHAEGLSLGALEGVSADLDFEGEVARGVDMNAADIEWSGPVGGDFRINAADVEFDGSIGGELRANLADGVFSGSFTNVRVNAADIELASGFESSGDVYLNAAEIEAHGRIGGGLDAAARTLRISGTVEGPLALYVDPGRAPFDREDGLVEISGRVAGGEICARRVVISGTVSGPLSVTADEEPVIRSGASAPDVSFTARDGRECERE